MNQPSPNSSPLTAREVAFLALLGEEYIDEAIFQIGKGLSSLDRDLAYLLAQGVKRHEITLRYFLSMLQKRIDLKKKERILLLMALYQYLFMDRIPIYAIVDETMKLIKKYGKKEQIAFCHALLRKMAKTPFALSIEKDSLSLSVSHSYPLYFVECLVKEYGLQTAEEILKVQNRTFPPMVRLLDPLYQGEEERVLENRFKVVRVEKKERLFEMVANPCFYIQNATPLFLLDALAANSQIPRKILDLCAAPGGKLIALHTLYPEAKLFANDISQERCDLLTQNCKKYQIDAKILLSPGQKIKMEERFDLILLDVPCSNSGVLHKRSEARGRLDKEHLAQLEQLQLELLSHAVTLLNPGGVIWYMTCSILFSENEGIVEKAKRSFSLQQMGQSIKQLPNEEGYDGGFGVALSPLLG